MLGYLKSAHNAFCDRRLGVRMAAEFRPPDTSLHRDASKSSTVGYSVINSYIRVLRLQPSDVVYDLGRGTGRPICVFACQQVKRCVGIEMDPDVAELARRNALHLVGRRPKITIIHGDAATADYHEGSAFWLYHPFGMRTLTAVLQRIRDSVAASPRQVRFCHVTLDAEQSFFECGWLTRYKSGWPPLHPSSAASFWRN
jgi:precorrin-6B methylase 2